MHASRFQLTRPPARDRWLVGARASTAVRAPSALSIEQHVSQHKIEQRRLTHRGRVFHFVSYEAVPANERRAELAVPPMWHLMNEGKRRPVMPHVPGQDPLDLDAALLRWVEERIFGKESEPA